MKQNNYYTVMLVSILLFSFSLNALTQTKPTAIEGNWLQLGQNGMPTLYGKTFLPNGRLYGFCLSKDMSNVSTWILADYKVLSDSVYQEHVFFHTTIAYQRDITMTYYLENDSMLVTTYTDVYPNGQIVPVTERWKKFDAPTDYWTDDIWASAYQQALVDFGRAPREGQSVAEKGKVLYDSFQGYLNNRQLDRANETLLIRAELDTTNVEWQNEVLNFYLGINATPAIFEKISNRYIRLCKSVAESPTDTLLFYAYMKQGLLYLKRGANNLTEARHSLQNAIDIENASKRPTRKDAGMAFFFMAGTYINSGDFESAYNYANQSTSILDMAPDAGNVQKGEAHYLSAMALSGLKQYEKSNEEIEIAAPLFVDDKGQPLPKLSEINMLKFINFNKLIKQNSKDKHISKAFQYFMEDKMLCVEISDLNNKWELRGEYYVLECDAWDMDHLSTPYDMQEIRHFLLQKDGKNYDINLEKEEKMGATPRVVSLDIQWKQQILKQWRNYKKTKKSSL